jgi:hypothetical protein
MSADMAFPFISLMDTCTPLGIVIRTPFNISDGVVQDDFADFGCDDNIVTGAIEGNGNIAALRLDTDMDTPCSRIHARRPR